MKCPVCSHVFPDTLSRCSRCGRVAPERQTETTGGSTLIEFPTARQGRGSLPDWRVELNEKVRAIKARRSMEALVGEAAALREAEPLARIEPVTPPEPDPDEHENPIVRAALNRVRRASENAARAVHQSPSRAAAAAKMPIVPAAEPVPEPPPRIASVPQTQPAPPERRRFIEPRPSQPSLLFDPAELLEGFDEELNPIAETEDAVAAAPPSAVAEVAAPAVASRFRRIVAGCIDVLILAAVSVPFGAIVYATEADLRRPVVIALLCVAVLALAAFYIGSTVGVAGRTVGMMLQHLRIETLDGERPRPHHVALRGAGILVCVLSAGIGFLWIFVSKTGRGWHDMMSGTRVVAD